MLSDILIQSPIGNEVLPFNW